MTVAYAVVFYLFNGSVFQSVCFQNWFCQNLYCNSPQLLSSSKRQQERLNNINLNLAFMLRVIYCNFYGEHKDLVLRSLPRLRQFVVYVSKRFPAAASDTEARILSTACRLFGKIWVVSWLVLNIRAHLLALKTEPSLLLISSM